MLTIVPAGSAPTGTFTLAFAPCQVSRSVPADFAFNVVDTGVPSEHPTGMGGGSADSLVVVPVVQVELEIVADFAVSKRGAGGFGHSGQR